MEVLLRLPVAGPEQAFGVAAAISAEGDAEGTPDRQVAKATGNQQPDKEALFRAMQGGFSL
jgi:hypothetical protein